MSETITRPIIDLDRRAWAKTRGDITLIGTWLLTTGRPVMVLVPTRPKATHDRVTPCLVPMDMAHLWDEHTGDPVHCARMSYQFAAALGLSMHEPRSIFAVTAAIRDHLGDLLTMPPMPDTEREVVADAILTDPHTGKSRETEISDDV